MDSRSSEGCLSIALVILGLFALFFSALLGFILLLSGLLLGYYRWANTPSKDDLIEVEKRLKIKELEDFQKQISDNPELLTHNGMTQKSPNIQPPKTYYNYANIAKNASLKSIANFVSLDVETTGLGSSDKIVEIGMVKYENHKPADQYQTLINPGFPIPKAAIKIHGITDSMVASAPDFSVCVDDINNFIGDYPIVGHNINFDFRLMKQSGHTGFSENKVFDTLSIARRTIEAENNKLDTLCRHFQIERDQAHRSISDCFDTAKLFQCLFEEKTGKKIPK